VLSVVPAKIVTFCDDEEEPSPRRPCAFSSALHGKGQFFVGPGEELYTHARAKLADCNDAHHGEARYFSQREGRSGPHAFR
jgi:hypothetical protein